VLSWLSLAMFVVACDAPAERVRGPGAPDDLDDLREDDDNTDDNNTDDNAAPTAREPAPLPVATPPYRAVGPQRDVPVADLHGWTPCFRETFGPTRTSIFTILQACDKPNLMLACRPTGAAAFTVLAHAPRAAVLTDTGRSNAPTIANGTGWYFNDDWSWGFAAAGDPIDRDECDDNTASNSDLRMCIPTAAGSTGLGFRCGDDFVYTDAWERVLLHAD